jgi:signal transduction histidine kinase/integral membrane sensor domain MASE1/ActR/RegA family two-component response regulator
MQPARRYGVTTKRPGPLAFLITALLYFGAAQLGFSLAFGAAQVTAVWPTTGIALVAVVLGGPRLWPAIWIAAFAANASLGEPWIVAAGIATGNTAEPLLGAYLLQRLTRARPSLERVRDVLVLAGLAAPLGAAVSATVGVSSLCLGGLHPFSQFGLLWLVWWVGDTMGVLLWAPPLLALSGSRSRLSKSQALETAALLVSLTAAAQLVFVSRFAFVEATYLPAYVVFPFVIWAALRLGQRVTTLAILVVSVLGISGTIAGSGPFSSAGVNTSLVLLHVFLSVVAVTGLVLAAATAEGQLAQRRRAADYAVTQILSQSPQLEAGQVLRAISENLGWDVAAFWVMDPSAGVLRCREVWSRPEAPAPQFEATTRSHTFEHGIGLPGRVWASGAPGWIPDVAKDPNFPRAPAAAEDGLHAAFGFPILLGREVLGVIEFFSREIRQPDDDLLRMFATVGSQLGQFLDRQRAEEERARLLVELKDAGEAKDRFLAILGHELRNPLAPVRNALEILRGRAAGDPVTQRMHELMERQLRHLVRLVDDLLDVTRINRGAVLLRPEPLNLGELVARAVETARPLLEERRQLLIANLTPEPLVVDADPTRLEQVVGNLLANASKYSEPGQRIEVSLAGEGGTAVLRVRDRGIGIPADMLARVFEPFLQGDHTRDRAQEGLGLGLTVVKSLVEKHGGTVEAASAGKNQGSELTVRLPLASRQVTAVTPAAPAAAQPQGPPLRVLVVDDNQDAAETLAFLLNRAGHEVRVAHDGPSALESARQQRPQVVLLDIGLPGMDGYEVARSLRTGVGLRNSYIVAITGFGQPDDRRKAEAAGFDDHLAKPVEPGRLWALLGAVAGEPMAHGGNKH